MSCTVCTKCREVIIQLYTGRGEWIEGIRDGWPLRQLKVRCVFNFVWKGGWAKPCHTVVTADGGTLFAMRKSVELVVIILNKRS